MAYLEYLNFECLNYECSVTKRKDIYKTWENFCLLWKKIGISFGKPLIMNWKRKEHCLCVIFCHKLSWLLFFGFINLLLDVWNYNSKHCSSNSSLQTLHLIFMNLLLNIKIIVGNVLTKSSLHLYEWIFF